MFKILANSAVEAFLPKYFLIGVFSVLLQSFLAFVFFEYIDTLPRFFYDFFVLENAVSLGFFELITTLVFLHSTGLIVLTVTSLFFLAVFITTLFCFSSLKSNQTKNFFETIIKIFPNLAKIVGISLFLWLVFTLYISLGLALIVISTIVEFLQAIGIVLFALWLITGLIIYLKLLFTPIIFFAKNKKIRETVNLTNDWSKKKTIATAYLILLTSLISITLHNFATYLSNIIVSSELAIIAIIALFSLSSTFSGLALVNYYYSTN